MSNSIWGTDPQRLIAYEPSWPVGDQLWNPDHYMPSTSGFPSLPQNSNGQRSNIYSFHYYWPPCTPDLSSYLDARVEDCKRLGTVPFLTEYAVGPTDMNSFNNFVETLNEIESRFIHHYGWEYKDYALLGDESVFFYKNGSLNTWVAKAYARPFTYLVQGHALESSFDPINIIYILRFNASDPMKVNAPTQIFVSDLWYPTGILVTTFPFQMANVKIEYLAGKGQIAPGVTAQGYSIVSVTNLAAATSQKITVTVQPK